MRTEHQTPIAIQRSVRAQEIADAEKVLTYVAKAIADARTDLWTPKELTAVFSRPDAPRLLQRVQRALPRLLVAMVTLIEVRANYRTATRSYPRVLAPVAYRFNESLIAAVAALPRPVIAPPPDKSESALRPNDLAYRRVEQLVADWKGVERNVWTRQEHAACSEVMRAAWHLHYTNGNGKANRKPPDVPLPDERIDIPYDLTEAVATLLYRSTNGATHDTETL